MISDLQFTSVILRQALVKSIRCNLSILTHTGQTSAGWYVSPSWDCTKEEAPDEECLTGREVKTQVLVKAILVQNGQENSSIAWSGDLNTPSQLTHAICLWHLSYVLCFGGRRRDSAKHDGKMQVAQPDTHSNT